MDLRVVKTERAIRAAYLELRRSLPPEKIRVKDICERALINKTTFYKHYADVLALAEELEDEAVERFFAQSRDIDCLFSAPERFIEGIPSGSDESVRPIRELFRGREDVFMSKMERYLLGYYREHDGIGTSDEVLLRFVISGATRTMQEMTSADGESEEAVTESLAGIIRELVG